MTGQIQSRQQRLAKHYLVEKSATARLRDTVTLAASALDFPHAQLNILDDETLYTITDFDAAASPMPRVDTMCAITVDSGGVLAIGDLRRDNRSAQLPGVVAGAASSYLGVPLRSREAATVGALCVFDSRPRDITPLQVRRIAQFGAIVEDQLDVIRRAQEQLGVDRMATSELSQAIDNGEIVPWYQPIVDLRTEQVIGYEALARWHHRTGEIETPARFVPIAEDSDLVVDLDRAVLGRAVEDLARWHRTRPHLRLNVNLSTRHLEIEDGISTVHDIVRFAGVAPETINIELTETRDIAEKKLAWAAVVALRGLGFGVLLDDFGNGWSSLDWILRLPVTGIKIDRAVTEAFGSPLGDAIARAVLSLTGEVSLDVVVEGISSRGHIDIAKTLGCQFGQGFFWSPPVPAERVDLDLACAVG